ncbi:MAG: hypothetical protein HPM95_11090 [Alphaproteobacteria bacterium]|nr:hypothetical protein [Alphaproteobacteria bacterium]
MTDGLTIAPSNPEFRGCPRWRTVKPVNFIVFRRLFACDQDGGSVCAGLLGVFDIGGKQAGFAGQVAGGTLGGVEDELSSTT